MTQKPIASVGPSVGRFKNADDNFTELYTAGASANTALTSLLATQTSNAAAWAIYTATATGNSAAIGTGGGATVTTANQLAIGKTQFFTISIAMGSATAACGTILVDLPATANTAAMALGYDVDDAFSFVGRIAPNTKVIRLARTDGTAIGTSHVTWIVSGVYEKQ